MSARKAAAAPARASTFLLVHGTGLGGWCWRKVAENLRAEGHVVFTPTLTGVGERAHLVSPAIGLDTHIDDVAAVAECEELERFIIVGHSYAGTVITGVCDRMRERIAHAVYIDAAATKNGQGNSRGRTLAQLSEVFGGLTDGYLLQPRDAGIISMGVTPADAADFAWLKRRLTPHPMKTWVDAIRLQNGGSDGLPRTFVFCNEAGPDSTIRTYAEQVRNDPSWSFREIASGHAAMVTHPKETAQTLMDIARLSLA